MRSCVLLLVLVVCAFATVSALQTQTRLRTRVPVTSDIEFVDEHSFVEQAPTGNVVLPAPVVAEGDIIPAITTPAPAGFKKPIIFNPAPPASATDPDEPLFGAPPANLKKANVSETLFGSAVEFEVSRNQFTGCPCKRQVPEKFRYDIETRAPVVNVTATPCGCLQVGAAPAKPEDALPPVIAQLRNPVNHTLLAILNGTLPNPWACQGIKVGEAPVVKIAPAYYPSDAQREARRAQFLAQATAATTAAKHEWLQANFPHLVGAAAEPQRTAWIQANAAPCLKSATPAAPATVQPEFRLTPEELKAQFFAQRRAARQARAGL